MTPGFLALLCVFLVAETPLDSVAISTIFVFLTLLIPGIIIANYLNVQNSSLSEKIIIGLSITSAIAMLIHPLMAKIGISKYSGLIMLILGLILLIFNKIKRIDVAKFNWIQFLVLLPFSIWVGRQANVVPIKNFDQFSIPPDIYHHLSLAAEIGNHGPEIYPYISASNVALQYHWGAFSLGSFLSAGGLVELPIALYRIEFVLLAFLLLFLSYFTGKFIGKSNFSGFIASLFGVLTLFPSFNISDGLQVPIIRTGSISQLAACVFLIAGLRIFLQICESKKNSIPMTLVLSVLVITTTLSKGPTGLLLLGIIILTSIILYFKKRSNFAILLSVGPLIGFIITLPFIFTFGPTRSSGMSLWVSPLATVKTILGYYDEHITSFNIFKASIILFVSSITYLIIIILNLQKRSIYFIPIFVGVVMGTFGLFTLEAWGNSQWFIYYPVAILVSFLLAEITPVILNKFNDLQLITYFFIGAIFQNSFFYLLRNWFDPSVLNLGILWVISVVFISTLSFGLSKSIWKVSNKNAFIASSLSILFVGFFSSLTYKDPYPYPVSNYEHPWSITVGTDASAKFIKSNSTSDEVIATNRHCVGPTESTSCIARVFSLSALSERRTFIEGWAYTTCPLREALNNEYWNQPLLKLNQAVVEQSNPLSTKELTKYGVRWLVIDQRRPHASDLSNIAEKKFESGQVQVWKIKRELISSEKPTYTGCTKE